MPPRKNTNPKKKVFRRKRRFFRRKRPQNARLTLQPFPKTRMVKLRYITNVDIDASAGAVATYGFRSNSIFDPDYSGTGNQPYYTDQMFASYNKCTVVGSKITITPFGASNTGTICGIYRDNDTTARTSNLVEVLEKPGTVWRSIGDSTQNKKIMSLTYSAKKTHGGKPLSNVELYCTAAADPVDPDFYRVFVGCPTSTTDPGSVSFLVKIEYTCVFHDRIEPATS